MIVPFNHCLWNVTNYIQCTDYIPTTYQLHVLKLCYWPHIHYIPKTCRPHTDNIPTIYQPHTVHINHIADHICHMPKMCWPCTYWPHTLYQPHILTMLPTTYPPQVAVQWVFLVIDPGRQIGHNVVSDGKLQFRRMAAYINLKKISF